MLTFTVDEVAIRAEAEAMGSAGVLKTRALEAWPSLPLLLWLLAALVCSVPLWQLASDYDDPSTDAEYIVVVFSLCLLSRHLMKHQRPDSCDRRGCSLEGGCSIERSPGRWSGLRQT